MSVYRKLAANSIQYKTKRKRGGVPNLLARIVDLGSAVACRTGIIFSRFSKLEKARAKRARAQDTLPLTLSRGSRALARFATLAFPHLKT